MSTVPNVRKNLTAVATKTMIVKMDDNVERCDSFEGRKCHGSCFVSNQLHARNCKNVKPEMNAGKTNKMARQNARVLGNA